MTLRGALTMPFFLEKFLVERHISFVYHELSSLNYRYMKQLTAILYEYQHFEKLNTCLHVPALFA